GRGRTALGEARRAGRLRGQLLLPRRPARDRPHPNADVRCTHARGSRLCGRRVRQRSRGIGGVVTEPSRTLSIDARPGPLKLEAARTAVVVVDMQNDFTAEDGMFARAGIPVAAIRAAVEPTARSLAAARRAGMKIVYLKMQFEPNLSNAGGPDAPNRLRHLALGVGEAVVAPDGSQSRVLIKDTWNTEILAAL